MSQNNSDDKPLVKARHDNSVLFSLKDLDSGGTPKGGKTEEKAKGEAQSDSSGFINLNAIASSTQYVNSGAGQSASEGMGQGAALAVPAMVQMGPKKDNKGVIIAVSVAAVALIAVLVVLIIVVMGKNNQPTTIIQQVPASTPALPPSSTPPASAAGADATKAEGDKKEEAVADNKAAEGEGEGEGEGAEGGDAKAEGDKKTNDKGGAVAKAGGNNPAKAEGEGDKPADGAESGGEAPPVEPPKEKPKPEGGNINDILDDIAGGNGKPKPGTAPAEKPTDNAVATGKKDLTREDVKDTVSRYGSRVSACGGPGKSGNVLVRFTVQPNGSVGSATVTGDKAGSPEGNCVAAAVRAFKFPAFDGAPKTITYPFALP